MKLSDYVAEYLAKHVDTVFCGNGGVVVHLLDSIGKRDDINLVPCQHEQSAAIAAEAYARIRGMGCAIATSGPGFVNMIQGIACAYYDSIPVLYIVGGCPTSHRASDARQQGFQEMDVLAMAAPITKQAMTVLNGQYVEEILNDLIGIAKNGRPGPVLLEIPDDVQRQEVEIATRKIRKYFPLYNFHLKEFMEMVKASKRPVAIIGGGVKIARAWLEMQKFLEMTDIPFVCSWAAVDIIDWGRSEGSIGICGEASANKIVQAADLIISFGCKLDTHQTGGDPSTFAPCAKKIMIDIDPAELEKQNGVVVDLKICADVKSMLVLLLKEHEWSDITMWQKEIDEIVDSSLYEFKSNKHFVDPYVFMAELQRAVDKNAVIISDTGNTLAWTMQGFHPTNGQMLFSDFNHSTMGYSIPAAIGVFYATRGERQIIAIIGDGGFAMCSHELATIELKQLPIKIFVMDNKGYGMVRQTQDTWLGGRHTAIDTFSSLAAPRIEQIAHAYKIRSERISHNGQLDKFNNSILKVLYVDAPAICVVEIASYETVRPKLKYGKHIGEIE